MIRRCALAQMGLLMLLALIVETLRIEVEPVGLIFSLTALAAYRWGPLRGGLAGLWGGCLIQAATGSAGIRVLALYTAMGLIAGLALDGFEWHRPVRRGLEALGLTMLLIAGQSLLLGSHPDAGGLLAGTLWPYTILLVVLEAARHLPVAYRDLQRRDLLRFILR